MNKALQILFAGLLLTSAGSCIQFKCHCYCVSGGNDTYETNMNLAKTMDVDDRADDKCYQKAHNSGHTCDEWACYTE